MPPERIELSAFGWQFLKLRDQRSTTELRRLRYDKHYCYGSSQMISHIIQFFLILIKAGVFR